MSISTTVFIQVAEKLIEKFMAKAQDKKAVDGVIKAISQSGEFDRLTDIIAAKAAKIVSGNIPTAVPVATVEEEPDTNEIKEEARAMLARSPRFGNLSIPDKLDPKIRITSCDINGNIEFEIPGFKAGRLPDGYTSNVITSDGDRVDDHFAGEAAFHDSRWNKHFGERIKAYMVALKSNKDGKLVAYSEVQKVCD